MIRSNLLSNNLKLLNLTSVNIFGSSLAIDTNINLRNNLFYINSNNKIGILNTKPQYTLDVVGDINLTGNIYSNGSIVTTEKASFSLWSNNSGYIFYNGGGVCVGTSSNPTPYIFYVNGTSYFVSQVNLDDNLVVNGDITCENITVTTTTTTNNLTTTGTTTLAGLTSSSSINTAGLNITSGDLNLTSGNITGLNTTLTCKNILVSDQTTFASNITFEKNVNVLGKLSVYSSFNVNDKFLINGSSGNISTSGSGTISNSLSVGGTFNVGGFSELNKVKINNDLDLNGNLYVNLGSTELNNLTVNSITKLLSDVVVDGGNVFVNTNGEYVLINYSTPSTSSSTGALVVSGGVGITGNMNIYGSINSMSGESEFVDLVVNDDFTANGQSLFNSDVEIKGQTTIYDDLICALPGGTITADYGLNVGIVSGSPALTVDDSGNLSTTGNAQITGDLDVTGDTTIQGNLYLSGSAASFSGGIITNCRFIEDNITSYDVYTTYSGSTFIIEDSTILTTINLPSESTVGTYYKFIIGPNYTTIGTIDIEISASSPIIIMFGLIDNNGTYTSIPSTTSTITLSSNAPGDFIEFSGVYVNSSGGFGYYINAKSSKTGGFTYS